MSNGIAKYRRQQKPRDAAERALSPRSFIQEHEHDAHATFTTEAISMESFDKNHSDQLILSQEAADRLANEVVIDEGEEINLDEILPVEAELSSHAEMQGEQTDKATPSTLNVA